MKQKSNLFPLVGLIPRCLRRNKKDIQFAASCAPCRGASFIYLFLLVCFHSYGQMNEYSYKRELTTISEQWHKVVLPNSVLSELNSNMDDVRIYGITASNDTIEAPYILRLNKKQNIAKGVPFEIINSSRNKSEYFFTLKMLEDVPINLLHLNFDNSNFDWKVQLGGSQNQEKWFSILEDYRILSIANKSTNYSFTNLKFSNAQYKYYRISVRSDVEVTLNSAVITLDKTVAASYRDYDIESTEVSENAKNKQTLIALSLSNPLPISYLQINVKDSVDYYRSINVSYLADSVNTEKGWRFQYRHLVSGTLASTENNEFSFSSVKTKKLKIVIENNDNEPLEIEGVAVKGHLYELLTRFAKPANYYLVYGNKTANRPNYDIRNMNTKIPDSLVTLQLGEKQIIEKDEISIQEPLFANKNWLWGIMGIIILVLGWFSIKMLKEK